MDSREIKRNHSEFAIPRINKTTYGKHSLKCTMWNRYVVQWLGNDNWCIIVKLWIVLRNVTKTKDLYPHDLMVILKETVSLQQLKLNVKT